MGTTLPRILPAAAARAAQPRDPYLANASLTLSGSGHAQQMIAQRLSGHNPETGIARHVQNPIQFLSHRMGHEASIGAGHLGSLPTRNEALSLRSQNHFPRLISDEAESGRKGILCLIHACLIFARPETRSNIPKENFISDSANFEWCVYLNYMPSVKIIHPLLGRESEPSGQYHNPQPPRES